MARSGILLLWFATVLGAGTGVDGRSTVAANSTTETPIVTTATGATTDNVTLAPEDPVSVLLSSPSAAIKFGEILRLNVTVTNGLNHSLLVQASTQNATGYELLSDPLNGGRRACVQAGNATQLTFRIRFLETGTFALKLEIEAQLQNNTSCSENITNSDFLRVATANITVEAEGFKRENTITKYVCKPERAEEWRVEPPSEAVEGSVKAWVSAATTYNAYVLEGMDSFLTHGRGDLLGLHDAAIFYLLETVVYNRENQWHKLSNQIFRDLNKAYKRQIELRRADNAFASLGSRKGDASSWMTAYYLTVGVIANNFTAARETWDWQIELQKEDGDGCFDSIGNVYNDLLKDRNNGQVSRALNTAYVMVSVGISATGGPPRIRPFIARDCLQRDRSMDPFTLAIKAYGMATAHHSEGENLLKDLFSQATETNKYIYWELPDDEYGTNAEQVSVSAYAALAIVRRYGERYSHKLEKMMAWLREQQNSQGGFNSVFDTMMAVRALLFYDSREINFNTNATVVVNGVNKTLHFDQENANILQRIDLPTLPANVTYNISGPSCTQTQVVVQYNVLDHYRSNAFNLTLNNWTDSNVTCAVPNRLKICTAYLLNRTSNLVAVEVSLVSGYTPLEEDLEAIITGPVTSFANYEVKGNKVTFFADGLSAEETCVDFGVTREFEVEDAKPGVVVVYDYYQPEVATSANYMISSSADEICVAPQ